MTLSWFCSESSASLASEPEGSNHDDVYKYVPLTELENKLVSLGTAPISTLTWLEGNHEDAVEVLRKRVQEIVSANPWLGGRLVKHKAKVHICYDPTKPVSSTTEEIFTHGKVDNNNNTLPIDKEMSLGDLSKVIQKEGSKLGMILTMGGEYEQCFWKVSVAPCCRSPSTHFGVIVSMSHVIGDGHTFYSLHNMLLSGDESPVTVESLQVDRISHTTESQEAKMGKDEAGVMHSWGLIVTALRGVFMSKILSYFVGDSLRTTVRYFLVDAKKIEAIKKFHTTEQQQQHPNDENGNGFPSHISTNDIITSWFLSNCNCSQGLMAINFRDKLEGHTHHHAGNYENCLYYRNPDDSATPHLIRRSVVDLKRAMTTDQPFSNLEFSQKEVGLVTNWSTFRHSSSTGIAVGGFREVSHVPIYDLEEIMPATIPICLIFRYKPDQLAVAMAGTQSQMAGLVHAPFESEESLFEGSAS